jgi:hypothetical protein
MNSWTCESVPNSDTAPWSIPTKYNAKSAKNTVAANHAAARAADRPADRVRGAVSCGFDTIDSFWGLRVPAGYDELRV